MLEVMKDDPVQGVSRVSGFHYRDKEHTDSEQGPDEGSANVDEGVLDDLPEFQFKGHPDVVVVHHGHSQAHQEAEYKKGYTDPPALAASEIGSEHPSQDQEEPEG